MTPQEKQMLQEIYEWMQEKKKQQISYPLDDASRNALGVLSVTGNGASALTQVYTDSNTDTHTGPKAYADTLIVVFEGAQYEIPYL
jgi:spore coat protein U-like protein